MNRVFTFVVALTLCAGCRQSHRQNAIGHPSPPEQKSPMNSPKGALEACALVTIEEVAQVQGTTITEAKSSATPTGNLLMSACYYNSKEPNKSVSLAVIQPNTESSSGSEARAYWADTFGRSGEEPATEKEKRGEKGEESEKTVPPKKVDGLGEEAYWSGNRVGGTLYVLKNNVILRVSVGGGDNEEVKLNKSRALAEKAIGRL
jgi:hypothetical protein